MLIQLLINLPQMSAPDTVPDDPRKAAHHIDASQFWAVLIGIYVYSFSCLLLHGCMNDVEKMAQFLVNDLGMSEDHIQRLLTTGPDTSIDLEEHRRVVDVTPPTCENIIDTLLNLSTKPEIQHRDNIIIYFSGHGAIYLCSDYYPAGHISAEGTIEALCPMDCRVPSGTDTSIPDISDREMNTILTEISRTKGRHITVILDCCHSSSITRDLSNTVRRANPLSPTSIKDMLDATHASLRDLPKYHSIFDGAWKSNMTSHVILAACMDYQRAEEGQGTDNLWNGHFMLALIEALKSDSLKEEWTYADLMSALKMPQNTMQTPMVAGNASARLWYQHEMSKKTLW